MSQVEPTTAAPVPAAASGEAVEPVQVLEDQPGMGHGKMGWLVSDPQVFWSSAAERN